MQAYHTSDIKLSSILIALGLKRRESDPITCMVQEKHGQSHEQFTFWIDVSDPDDRKKCASIVDAYYKFTKDEQMILGEEHPVYYMICAFQNRDRQLDEMRQKVTPMKTIRKGNVTMIIPAFPSDELKRKISRL